MNLTSFPMIKDIISREIEELDKQVHTLIDADKLRKELKTLEQIQ